MGSSARTGGAGVSRAGGTGVSARSSTRWSGRAAVGSIWGPMAMVIMGGLFCATLLTLFVVPVFYNLLAQQSSLR